MVNSTNDFAIDSLAVSTNQCLCLPKVELKTKISTKRQFCRRLVEFLVFNSIYYKKTWSLFRELPLPLFFLLSNFCGQKIKEGEDVLDNKSREIQICRLFRGEEGCSG